MLKTTISSEMFIVNEDLATNQVSSVEGGNKLIEKYRKLSKNCLNLENWLSQEKNCQKVEIHLILAPKKTSQSF